jgi:hypothetical protein
MKPSTENEIAGKVHEVKGKLKSTVHGHPARHAHSSDGRGLSATIFAKLGPFA